MSNYVTILKEINEKIKPLLEKITEIEHEITLREGRIRILESELKKVKENTNRARKRQEELIKEFLEKIKSFDDSRDYSEVQGKVPNKIFWDLSKEVEVDAKTQTKSLSSTNISQFLDEIKK